MFGMSIHHRHIQPGVTRLRPDVEPVPFQIAIRCGDTLAWLIAGFDLTQWERDTVAWVCSLPRFVIMYLASCQLRIRGQVIDRHVFAFDDRLARSYSHIQIDVSHRGRGDHETRAS